MKRLCAFSSDARELYKADIYRVFSFPDGHIMHFRYNQKYIDPNLLNDTKALKGKLCTIFFSANNDISKKSEQRAISNISVRDAEIVNTELSRETNLFHLYLKLGDFSNLAIDSNNPKEKYPPTLFLSELECTISKQGNDWLSRTNDVKQHFPNMLFYRVTRVVDSHGHAQNIHYSNSNKVSYYKLTNQSRYYLNMSFSNENNSLNEIHINGNDKLISINSAGQIRFQGRYDDSSIPFTTSSIDVPEATVFLNFSQKSKTSDFNVYDFQLEIHVIQRISKIVLFGLLSGIGIIAIKFISDSVSTICNIGLALAIAGCASALYYLYNKK